METIGELAEALPHTELHDLPRELREKINAEVVLLGHSELVPYFMEVRQTDPNSNAFLQAQRAVRTARIYHNQEMTVDSQNVLNAAENALEQARGAFRDADREYNRMVRVIGYKLSIYNRLLKRHDERPFR